MITALIGQFSEPITGEVTCNKYVKEILENNGREVIVVDSNLLTDASDVGRFSLGKLFLAFLVIFSGMRAIWKSSSIYIVPGQTFLGIVRVLPLLIFSRVIGKPPVLHWHGYGLLSLADRNIWILRFIFFLSLRNIILTNDLLQKLMALGLSKNKISIVRNFSSYSSLDELKVQSERLKVLYLGSLTLEKGYDLFLNAVAYCPNLDFVACGGGDPSLVQASYSLEKKFINFKYFGIVKEPMKRRVIEESDVFVLLTSYKTEGVPLSILDAISCGLAIVATPHNGIPETLDDCAIWLNSVSPEKLSLALNSIDLDRCRLRELRYKSLKKSKEFQPEIFTREILKII